MSSLRNVEFSIWSIVLTCATAFFCGTFFQRNGISTISAHCTYGGANMHVSFHRNFNQTYSLAAEQTVTAFLRKGQNARFSVHLDQTSPLIIAIHIDQVGVIVPQLFYNESVNLSKYFLANASIYNIPCAPSGRYDVLVASKGSVQINVNISQQKPFLAQKLLQYVQTSRIRHENHIHKRQTIFKWDKSKLDIHAVQYCLAINGQSNQRTFCDAMDHVIGRSPNTFCSRLKGTLNNYFFRPVDRISNIDSKRDSALACTGLRNKHTLAGLNPNKKYFVDVFGIHKMVPGLIFKLASTSFVFNCTNPIELHEDHTEIGRITEFDKRSSFVFKPNYTSNVKRVMFLILPCGHPMKVKIMSLKKVKKVVDINSATMLKFNNFKESERFVVKFSPTNTDESLHRKNLDHFVGNFKIVATTKSKFVNYPMLPADMRVQEVTSLSTCSESTIEWHSSPDPRPITYCIAAIKIRAKSFNDFITSIDTCDMEKYQKKFLPNKKYDCITSSHDDSSAKSMERFKLKYLEQNHGYVIHVTLKVNKEVISYQTLKLFKSHHCFKQILNNTIQLPTFPNATSQHIEDNNIFVS
ncbi:uncharacterized protein LOC116336893 isoform X2 [Contarinia nasturtii]|uniref:uncharacterized protein LOC116336893 isoform X2 n=1 Tax=Contarinia nasturtii TaxID=265458 RepID=UPI0012D4C450|nr:uncharacterized protein LOC116336893 isoform X2 [Contarinia nasturtii]